MSIAVWGPKVFSASLNKVYTFDDYNFSSSINIEDQEVEGSKPSTYIKGLNGDEVSFTIKLLNQKNVNVRDEIISWINLQNYKVPYMLIINNKPITCSKFLLTSVQVSNAIFDSNGDYIRADLAVSFKEYTRKGVKSKK